MGTQRLVHSRLALGTALREARKTLGLTQHEVARRTGLAQPTISNFERGLGAYALPDLLPLLATLELELILQPRISTRPDAPWAERG
jgi:transcriptional regulator with XRE-family HTH domain